MYGIFIPFLSKEFLNIIDNCINLNDYTLFAIVVEDIEEVILVSCALGTGTGANSVSKVGRNEYGLNGGPSIYGYRAEITISEDGDSYQAKALENSFHLFFRSTWDKESAELTWSISQSEYNITKIYALM